jgi:redox-sensitive bicupin YhaK (pirin superfamily)
MELTSVKKIIEPMPASDGAGVKLKRAIGTPELDYYDPFLMLDEFGSDNAEDYVAGFPSHPHRGIETVTYMLQGEFEHQDSTGAKGRMTSGDVQWMKTGRGIIHSEMPAMSEGKLQGFQLWINMPAELKKNKPEYIYIDSKQMQTYKDLEKKINIIAGKYQELVGPVGEHNVEPIYFDIELNEGKEFNFELSSTHNSFIYLVDGDIKIGDQTHEPIQNSKLIILNKEKNLDVLALKNSKFLLISGKPIGEPIARGGPFVMNTEAEIQEAIQDFHNGTFAKY